MQHVFTKDRAYYQSLVALTIPVAMQNLITFLVGFADNLMVNTLGDTAVSGVYIGSQMQTLLQMFTSGVGGAIVIIAAQYWGKKDTERIRTIVSIGLRVAALVGLIITALCVGFAEPISRFFTKDEAVVAAAAEYLRLVAVGYVFFCVSQTLIAAMRSVETVRIGMVVSLISLVVNIASNWTLIFGKLGFPALGIRGAAIATVLSRFTEMVVMMVYVGRVDRRLGMRAGDLVRRGGPLTRDFLRYGAPLVAGEIVWSVNMMMNSRILGQYGAAVITAASVANNMNAMAYIFISGMASAVGVITGKTVGAGRTELMKEYARTTEAIFLCLGVLMGLLLTALNRPFVSLYGGISPEAAAQSRLFIRVLSVTIIGTCYQMPCLFGLVKSGGDISFVFKNDTIFVFGVVLPSALIAAHFGAPAWVTFACLKCDQVLKCVVAFFKIRRWDWMKKLTRENA